MSLCSKAGILEVQINKIKNNPLESHEPWKPLGHISEIPRKTDFALGCRKLLSLNLAELNLSLKPQE